MRRWTLGIFLFLVAFANAQDERTIVDEWYVLTLNGKASGWAHEAMRTRTENGRQILRSEQGSQIRMKRVKDELKIEQDAWFEETADGTPLRFRYRTLQAKSEVVQEGTLEGSTLTVTVTSGGTQEKKTLDWKQGTLFPAAAQRMMKEKGFAEGTSYSYQTYDPQFGKIVTGTINVLAPEKMKIAGQEREWVKWESSTDAMKGIKTTTWGDKDAMTWRTAVSMAGMAIVTERTDKAAALLTEKGEVPEVLVQSFLRPNKKFDNARKIARAVYRITIKQGEAQAGGLAYEGQSVDKVEGNVITLTVKPAQPADPAPKRPIDDAKLKEYLAETAYLQITDPKVVAASKDAVGDETDAWKAARKIETWVFQKISKKNFGVGFASAKEVAERLEGDCTEHAVLAAAMARAAGIPARIAVGLVSVSDIYGGHMWTEVWVGKWVGIDAAMGGEFFDATHIKMGDSAGSGQSMQEDLVNVLMYLGKMDLEVVEVDEKK